jgi:asparagine synthase (glutamine-hydrolysing)
MLDLFAIVGPAAAGPIRTTRRSHVRQTQLGQVYLSVEGDTFIDPLFFEDSQVTLVCRTDLLSSTPVANTAAHLVRLYREQGDSFASGLRGSFAIILYDHKQRMLKAWADHFGAERLVFAEFDNSLAVSTHIGLVANALPRHPEPSPAAIQEYLQYTCIPGPRTIYPGIVKLPAGHQLVSSPRVSTRPYWDLRYEESSGGNFETDLRDGLRSAVSLNLSNLKETEAAGCFLSGGTDSSSVSGFVGRVTGQPPRTFSIGFDDPRYNEIEYARIAAKHFQADHHEYFVKPEDIPTLAQKAVQVYDEPFGNSSIVPTYYCARLAAEHGVSHLLAGDGGDELFGGNSRYADDRVFQRYSQIPAVVRRWMIEPAVKSAAGAGFRFFKTASSYVRRSNIPAPDRYFSYSIIQSLPATELFTPDFAAAVRDADPTVTARNHFQKAPARQSLNRWLYMDMKITIADNDLRKVMAMSRLAGVTPRFPFLNPELAELSGRIPVDMKVRGTQLRYLFKKAMAEVLPPEILTKKKHGFGLPYSVWLGDSKPLRDFTFDALRSQRSSQRGYFRPGLIDSLWSQYQSVHRGYYGEILWTLLMLELWHVAHVDTKPATDDRAVAVAQTN